MKELIIKDRRIADNEPFFVIAEIGHNHGGNLQRCKDLFKAAKECGCDAVKLQKRNNKLLYTKAFYNKPYENENSYGKTYGEHREALEFNYDQYAELKKYATELGIIFFATAFDVDSVDFLQALDMPAFKIASGDVTNIPLIRYIGKQGKPIIMSTGGCTEPSIVWATMELKNTGQDHAILHCVATYPSKPEELNLSYIERLKAICYPYVVGLSCHYSGIEPCLIAASLGAKIFEKHFTLNRSWKGTDHAFSLEPTGMRKLVNYLKLHKIMLGDGIKRRLDCEKEPIRKMAKAIHIIKPIKKGENVSWDNVGLKTPADGLPAFDIETVIGKVAINDLSTSDTLTWGAIE